MVLRRTLVLVFILSATACGHRIDPDTLLHEADGLAWLKAWGRAEPLYTAAAREYTRRGDRRNAIYAQVGALRGRAATLPAVEVSDSLAAYLTDSVVQQDESLRLWCLLIKSDTDINLDPLLAERSLDAALTLAKRLNKPLWVNRLEGELAITAFLQGNVGGSVVALGRALKAAETNADTPAQIRFLTLFGLGYTQLGRNDEALSFFDRALLAAATLPDIDVPVMTYVGKAGALAGLGRADEAERLTNDGLAAARRQGSVAYEAELTMLLGSLAAQRRQPREALARFAAADELARHASSDRIREELSLDWSRVHAATGNTDAADAVLENGATMARRMQDRILLPRILAQLADVRVSRGKSDEAAALLEEAADVSEGLLVHSSSPWLRARIVRAMDEVFVSRIRLEAQRATPARLFDVIEQARARSLSDLLGARRQVGDVDTSPELRAGATYIAALQSQLFRTRDHDQRQRLLDAIFVAEENLGPALTERFDLTQSGSRPRPVTLEELQATLNIDEVFAQFALSEPHSIALLVRRDGTTIAHLPGQITIEKAADALTAAIDNGEDARGESAALAALLAPALTAAHTGERLIINTDGQLHRIPFELLPVPGEQRRLLEQRVVSYIPSGTVLVRLRARAPYDISAPIVLAVSASSQPAIRTLPLPALGQVSRGVYDVEPGALPELLSAPMEARSVIDTFATSGSQLLLAAEASEPTLKASPLDHFALIHFAVHGVVSTQFPERSALVLRAAGDDDGLLQAREILGLKLKADLVTLSACASGAGSVHGQDGVASLVRPFLAAGARSVVANLWTADDRFSLAIMKQFYAELHAGVDKATALRDAKMAMLHTYGVRAVPKLWAGLVINGDAAAPLPPSLVSQLKVGHGNDH
jgi:CHAT domain-containing protein